MIELKPNNECMYCVSGQQIPFSTSWICSDVDVEITLEGYPKKYFLELKTQKCKNFVPDPEKI